ncbi:MAG TPA: exodeoxyribonuclease VII large subunit [Candidatus Limiplasma sp.]|nr:exodeoxyribonuclease VII large subunit [Candidatus Limiplasma sp.]HRX08687.1 exodeoxyribonuclease VII large subunit [Candidatus Limiplasma sp.]
MSTRLTLTVEELNEYVRKSLAGDPMLRNLSLRGEISNFKRHVSGHLYFTLKDENSAIQCAMFRTAAIGLKFRPADGMKVVLRGNVGLYVKTGSYQFYADGMEEEGLGDIHLRMEALKKKLQAEGLFDASLKKPLPLLPMGVGIATSKTGAVIHDMTRVGWRRHPGIPFYLYPVSVQGAGAAKEIAAAVEALDRLDEVDVIIVARGGGSLEDLWEFNEEVLARAIFNCQKPVVSAVGHETDFSISDFVADLRAPTPSAAAELVVPQREQLLQTVEKLQTRTRRACEMTLAGYAAGLSELSARIARQTPERQFGVIAERVQGLSQRLTLLYKQVLEQKARALSELSLRITAASPRETLKRGYAIVRRGKTSVQSVTMLKPDDLITITLADGSAEAKTLRVLKEDE